MPLNYFGIFLGFGPFAHLQGEGLARLLAVFLKAAATRDDTRFVIVCPQWSRRPLLAFLESEGIPVDAFDVVSTKGVPVAFRLYAAYLRRKKRRPGPSRLGRLIRRLRHAAASHRKFVELHLVTARSVFSWAAIMLYVVLLGFVLLPFAALGWLIFSLRLPFVWMSRTKFASISPVLAIVTLLDRLREPGEESISMRLYHLMEDSETKRLQNMVNSLTHVKAWYSPMAFWPAFNGVAGPRLLCVPDIVPFEFPTGFAREEEMQAVIERMELSIHGSRRFVTYSSNTKWNLLVSRYSIDPPDIAVIPHGCWDLSPHIRVMGFPDAGAATRGYCESLLQRALARLGHDSYVQGLASGSLRFIFYASQFRPNKNVVTLLQAYEHLLRDRFIGYKLILTGNPNHYSPVKDFVREHELGRDVLFLHGLTTAELAACYYLADLAVNPSLSEGGCPFTLTEALSVDTPVLMSRIAVTEEVIVDPDLQEMMLFDPYDYRHISSRIEWALKNRESLLPVQRGLYAQLSQRTWRIVVDEYIAVLDRISADAETAAGSRE